MEPLGFDGGNKVAAKIAKLDPEGRYVRLNLVTHSVEYSREFEFGEEISDFTGEEEICRAFIVCWLCTIGGYLPNCIALERRYSIGRPKTGAELDILLRRVDGLAYALIEVKAPLDYTVDQDSFIKRQLFNIAPTRRERPFCRLPRYRFVMQAPKSSAKQSITRLTDGLKIGFFRVRSLTRYLQIMESLNTSIW